MNSHTERDPEFLTEELFVRRLHLEQRRTERSRRPFILMLLQSANLLRAGHKNGACDRVLSITSASIRDTDVYGWYEEGSILGVIFTEIGDTDCRSIGNILLAKMRASLESRLTAHQFGQIKLSVYMFPDDWDKENGSTEALLYPDSVRSRRPSLFVKRCIDITGSLAAIIFASPVFLLIAAAIKLTSKGPILYRQTRVGQYGRKFTFLKFRSMHANNNSTIHKDFVTGMIAGSAKNGAQPTSVYKITNDPRVTAVGRFIRKTSLDEIPQFFNVLKGEMSLVGPRPPIPYEVEVYDIWHRRRLLGVKPGITGLWQVHGRCRTTFDDMVRLDLQYAKTWSVWLDLKILLQTPRAVVAGDGAY